MLSREQDTKERLTELGSFKKTDSERLEWAKARQAQADEIKHEQDMKLVGLLIVAAFIGFMIGIVF